MKYNLSYEYYHSNYKRVYCYKISVMDGRLDWTTCQGGFAAKLHLKLIRQIIWTAKTHYRNLDYKNFKINKS